MEYLSDEQKSAILDAAVIHGDFLLASGRHSNVKFEIDNVRGELFAMAVAGIADCIADNYDGDEFNTIVTVATGANAFGDPLADELRNRHGISTHHIPSRKDEDGNFYVLPVRERDIRVILVDDVYTSGKSLEAVKREVERKDERWKQDPKRVGGKVIGAATLLNRSGLNAPRLSGNIPVYSALYVALD